MKTHLLTAALMSAIAIAPQAGPRTAHNRPHIEPVMRLQPVAAAADAYELLVYGDIGDSWWGESVTAKEVIEQLNALDASVKTINVRINSYGGSVSDGLAIFNVLNRHPATKAVTIDGVAMSSASLIAMVGTTVHMPATSILMIHAPWGGLMGNAVEMRRYADILDTYSDSMADAYVAKSGMDRAAVLALLTDGDDHYYTGTEAVAAGFADAIDDGSEDTTDASASSTAKAFAKGVEHYLANAPENYRQLAIAAALRAPAPPAAASTLARQTPALPSATDAARMRAALAAPTPLNPPAPAEPTPPADAGHTTGDAAMTEEEKKALAAARAAALKDDADRRNAIRAQFAPFASRTDIAAGAIAKLQTECEDDHAVTAEVAGAKLLALLGTNTTPSGSQSRGGPDGLTHDETKSYREGAIKATLHRANPSAYKIDEQSREFRGMDLMDLARDSVERAGTRTRGLSKAEIAIKALHTTSDFPSIMENVITRTLRQGYETAARTFTAFSRQTTLPDFKAVSRVQLGGAPNLKRVLEGAEYEHGTIGDGAEKISVQKYGRIVAVSWETVINDDLDALTRIPQAFGASAAELESDIVYAILTGNPLMADGQPLFSAAHSNLGTPADLADALDPTLANPIAEMRKLMTLQKGLDGRYVTVRPKFLIVPPSLEEVALKVTSANFVANRGTDLNVFGPTLTPISEPRLEDASSTAWFGAAEPTNIDTIEYAYLEGYEGVFTETKQGFEVDGVHVKCRHVFGAKAIDSRGLFKNNGA